MKKGILAIGRELNGNEIRSVLILLAQYSSTANKNLKMMLMYRIAFTSLYNPKDIFCVASIIHWSLQKQKIDVRKVLHHFDERVMATGL